MEQGQPPKGIKTMLSRTNYGSQFKIQELALEQDNMLVIKIKLLYKGDLSKEYQTITFTKISFDKTTGYTTMSSVNNEFAALNETTTLDFISSIASYSSKVLSVSQTMTYEAQSHFNYIKRNTTEDEMEGNQ